MIDEHQKFMSDGYNSALLAFGRKSRLAGAVRAPLAGLFFCAEHIRQLEGESPFHNRVEVK